jgi:hypothetical protein
MFEVLSPAEIDCQHVELLPVQTVLSLFSTAPGGGKGSPSGPIGGTTNTSGNTLLPQPTLDTPFGDGLLNVAEA